MSNKFNFKGKMPIDKNGKPLNIVDVSLSIQNREEYSATQKAKAMRYVLNNMNGQVLKNALDVFHLNGFEKKAMIDYFYRGYTNPDEYSSNYQERKRDEKFKDIHKRIQSMKASVNGENSRQFSYVSDLINGIKNQREYNRESSIMNKSFHEKVDYIKKWAIVSARVCHKWWEQCHQRTTVDVGIYGRNIKHNRYRYGSSSEDTPNINKQEEYQDTGSYVFQNYKRRGDYYHQNKIDIPPLWYHKIYRHGLQTVVYKSRPCMVIKLTSKPIQRLREKSIDVYKADIISAKEGQIGLHKDIWLLAYVTSEYQRGDQPKSSDRNNRHFTPEKKDVMGVAYTSSHERLEIAEQTMNKRLMSGITKTLDI